MVAEDVETNQKIAREMIQMLGHTVDIAKNGREAVKGYATGIYDLIFMDCQMPIMDGYEATRKIRDIEKKCGSEPTPIIALTAGFDKQDEGRCKSAGMDQDSRRRSVVQQTAGCRENPWR